MTIIMTRWRLFIFATFIACAHYLTFTRLWGEAFAASENDQAVSSAVAVTIAILSFPGAIITKFAFPSDFLGRWHWWGDASNFIQGFAVVNAICWGCAIAVLVAVINRVTKSEKKLSQTATPTGSDR